MYFINLKKMSGEKGLNARLGFVPEVKDPLTKEEEGALIELLADYCRRVRSRVDQITRPDLKVLYSYSLEEIEGLDYEDLNRALSNLERVQAEALKALKYLDSISSRKDEFEEELNNIMESPILASDPEEIEYELLLKIEAIDDLIVEIEVEAEGFEVDMSGVQHYWLEQFRKPKKEIQSGY